MVCGSSTAISEDNLTSAKREEGRHVSFSSEVKEELSRQDTSARHCRLAELAAIIGMCGDVCISAMERYRLRIHTENEAVARKCFTLLRKTFSINSDVSVHLHKRNGKGSQIYTLLIRDHAEVLRVLQAPSELNTWVRFRNRSPRPISCLYRNHAAGGRLSAAHFWQPVRSAIRRSPITLRLSVSHRSEPNSCRH